MLINLQIYYMEDKIPIGGNEDGRYCAGREIFQEIGVKIFSLSKMEDKLPIGGIYGG